MFLILLDCASRKKEEEQIQEQDTGIIREMEEEELPIQDAEEEEPSIEETGDEAPAIEKRKRENDENNDTRDTLKLEELNPPEIAGSYAIGSQKYLSFLPQFPRSAIEPEDFNIGSLYNEGDASPDARLIEGIISGFFVSLKENKIDTSLLYEGEKSGLYRLLTFHMEMKNVPQEFRIGKITMEEMDTGYAAIRLFGKKGKTDGEIYVRKKENKWYISDMQFNFYELEIPAEKSGGKFMPTTYHWLIQGM